MSFVTTLANLKVRTKIAIGFGLVLAILTIVGATGAVSVSRIGTNFDKFVALSKVSSAADEIEVAVLTLRRNAREFALTGKPDLEGKARESIKQTSTAVSHALSANPTPEQRKILDDIVAQSGQYVKAFDRVVEIRKDEIKTQVEIIDPMGVKLRTDFDLLAAAAARAGNSNAQILALTGLEALMVARLDANKALARHDAALVKTFETSFAHLLQTLKGIEAAAKSPDLKPLYDEIKDLTNKYQAAFHHALKDAEEIERLLNGDMVRLGQAINDAAETIKHMADKEEDTINDLLHGMIGSAVMIGAVLSVVGIVLGIAFAWVIGSGIAGPVVGMTAAMQKLAGGNKTVEIPGVERKDEIGQMAATVQVFKENMIKADQLAAEQRAEQERKAKRQTAIEGFIAHFESTVASALKTLASASTELQSTANAMSATAEQTQRQSTAVAAASEEATTNVQTVASAAEELSASITEISRQVSTSTRIAGQAVDEASSTNAKVQRLAEAASKIGDVVKLITDIAGQTNLLALNATIEAARAGEAGKGFAVVASEVKSLATQTARATEEISAQITAIQAETRNSVESIESIGKTIGDINQIATTIAAAVEEQGAATQEIARNVQQAAAGTTEVSSNISGVNQAAAQTGAAATQVLASAGELSKQAETLRAEVDGFLANIRAA